MELLKAIIVITAAACIVRQSALLRDAQESNRQLKSQLAVLSRYREVRLLPDVPDVSSPMVNDLSPPSSSSRSISLRQCSSLRSSIGVARKLMSYAELHDRLKPEDRARLAQRVKAERELMLRAELGELSDEELASALLPVESIVDNDLADDFRRLQRIDAEATVAVLGEMRLLYLSRSLGLDSAQEQELSYRLQRIDIEAWEFQEQSLLRQNDQGLQLDDPWVVQEWISDVIAMKRERIATEMRELLTDEQLQLFHELDRKRRLTPLLSDTTLGYGIMVWD